MSLLRVYDEDVRMLEEHAEHGPIADRLQGIGVVFERWRAEQQPAPDAGQEEVLSAYRAAVDRLNSVYGFKSVDVIALRPDHPDRDAMRRKFLDEHTHDDFEVRFFVDGRGLFYIHADDKVYVVLCEQGDLISVPAGARHWFDMGAAPDFKCIRFFTTPQGWEASFTGSDIAGRFPSFDNLVRDAA